MSVLSTGLLVSVLASRDAIGARVKVGDDTEQSVKAAHFPEWKAAACTGCSDCRYEEDNSWFGLREDAVFECFACPEGSALLKGPPPGGVGLSFLHGEYGEAKPIFVRSHCARMGHDERKVLMLRHGQSQWNVVMEQSKGVAGVVGLWSGWKDSPLSALGLRQAQRLAQILDKADRAISGEESSYGALVGVMREMNYTNLESLVRIVNKTLAGKEDVSDAVAVAQLLHHKEALDVLLGRKCQETAFISSQLVRAMDTILIATLPSRTRCAATWEISSNLQEIEHNADCDARTSPGSNPDIEPEQFKVYVANQMTATSDYVKSMYQSSDVSRFTRNMGAKERLRLFDQTPQMADELQHMFSSSKKYAVLGGHSIWFRQFFQAFGDHADETCKELMKVKIANTGVVSAQIREVPEDPQNYVATKCEYIHLGPSDEYKFKLDASVATEELPTARDFDHDVKQIMGWECCCARVEAGVRGDLEEADDSVRKCLLVKTAACGNTAEWEEVQGESLSDALNRDTTWESEFGTVGGCTAEPKLSLEEFVRDDP